MRMGLERCGWQIAWANDIDPDKREMYDYHFHDADTHFVLGDVHQIKADAVPAATLATASFPCNDLSLAGARAGIRHGQHSSAYWGFIDVIEKMGRRRPRLVMLENVVGFLSSHNGHDFRDALLALNELGYSVDAHILDAIHFVPQSRQRLFVFGVLQRQKASAVGEKQPVFFECQTRPRDLAQFIIDHPEIDWSPRQLPSLPEGALCLKDVLEDVSPASPQWWSKQRVEYLLDQMSPRHLALAEQMKSATLDCFGTIFRRVRNGRSMAELRTDGIAGCLRTPRGGSGRQILLAAGKGRIRARLLNGRECARLMGADDFLMDVPLNQALFGFGDAVCVPVISWIGENYLSKLLCGVQDNVCVEASA